MKTLLLALVGLAGFGFTAPSAEARDNDRYRERQRQSYQYRHHHHHPPRVVYYRSGPRYIYDDGYYYNAPRRVYRPSGLTFFFRF